MLESLKVREAVSQLAPLRILIVDDFPSWRRFVFSMLEDLPEFRIVGEACDGIEAVHKSAELQPDLVLLDIGLPRLHGIDAAKQICTVSPHSKILFISENQCKEIVDAALRATPCARGFLVKSDAVADLGPALRALVEDRQFISPRLLSKSEPLPSPFGPLWSWTS